MTWDNDTRPLKCWWMLAIVFHLMTCLEVESRVREATLMLDSGVAGSLPKFARRRKSHWEMVQIEVSTYNGVSNKLDSSPPQTKDVAALASASLSLSIELGQFSGEVGVFPLDATSLSLDMPTTKQGRDGELFLRDMSFSMDALPTRQAVDGDDMSMPATLIPTTAPSTETLVPSSATMSPSSTESSTSAPSPSGSPIASAPETTFQPSFSTEPTNVPTIADVQGSTVAPGIVSLEPSVVQGVPTPSNELPVQPPSPVAPVQTLEPTAEGTQDDPPSSDAHQGPWGPMGKAKVSAIIVVTGFLLS
jgi:hypothetical protein